MKRGDGILVNWYWLWLVSGMLVGAMVVYLFADYPNWFALGYHGIDLSREMNYAVWWAGLCLLFAGIIFARVGEIAAATEKPAWPWYILAMVMLALCFDEVGSLHEFVAREHGWSGLLPFALLFALALGCALFRIGYQRGFGLVLLLVLSGFCIFVFVAGLEWVEHNSVIVMEYLPDSIKPYWGRLRLVTEEGSELLAMALLVTAGLVAIKRMGDTDRSFLNVMSVVDRLLDVPLLVFVLFVSQVVITGSYLAINYKEFPAGNPAVLYPMLLFFSLGIIARLRVAPARQSNGPGGFWILLAIVFFTASALQMYNFHNFFTRITGLGIVPLEGPPVTCLFSMIPLLYLVGFAIRNRLIGPGDYIRPLVLLLAIFVLVYPDMDHRYRVEFHYFIFSSAVAYSCYQLMGRIDEKLQSLHRHLPNTMRLSKLGKVQPR